jgi:hypothetical protein
MTAEIEQGPAEPEVLAAALYDTMQALGIPDAAVSELDPSNMLFAGELAKQLSERGIGLYQMTPTSTTKVDGDPLHVQAAVNALLGFGWVLNTQRSNGADFMEAELVRYPTRKAG